MGRLKSILNQIIKENNALVTTRTGVTKSVSYKNPSELDMLKRDSNVSDITATSGQKLKEAELAEAAKFSVGDESLIQDFFDKTNPSQKMKDRIRSIISVIKDSGGPLTGGKIAAGLGISGQQPIYRLLLDLETAGILSAANMVKVNRASSPRLKQVQPDDLDGLEDETPQSTTEPTDGEIDDFDVDAGSELSGDETDLFVGTGELSQILAPYFSDDEEETPEQPEETPEQPVKQYDVTAASKATDFFLDNDRLLQKLINTYAATRSRVKEDKEDGGLSSSDFNRSEKNRKERSVSQIDTLIDQFVGKIQQEDEETQFEIMRMLQRKLESVNATYLFKSIARKMNFDISSLTQNNPLPESYNVDEEDEVYEELDESIMYRFKKLANIK
jgi:hypothetical protein